MKRVMFGFLAGLLLIPALGHGQEQFPSFSRDYWVNQESQAVGKIKRGAGLATVGLVSIWPTALLISHARDNEPKYLALSVVMGMATLGATLHGINSVVFGKKQKDAARAFVDAYDADAVSVNLSDEQGTYLHDARKTARKTLLFGTYLSAVAGVLVTNGITQSVRKHNHRDMDNIRIWPYYLSGGVLLAAGVAVIVKSWRKLDALDTLSVSDPAVPQVGIGPFFTTGDKGESSFGVAWGRSF